MTDEPRTPRAVQARGFDGVDDQGVVVRPDGRPTYQRLSTFGDSPVVDADREDWIATISAGDKTKRGDGYEIPFASRDGRIFLHDDNGRAPELARRLEANDWKHLTIAFPSNDPAQFIREHFTIYSASMVIGFGDATQFVYNEVIAPKADKSNASVVRHVFDVGTAEYEKLRTRVDCKVSTSIFFALARWDGLRSHIEMPDGFGYYRIRTTSHNSVDNLYAAIGHLARANDGQIAGIPFDVFLNYRPTSDRTGTRRTIPVWTFSVRPPQVLTSQNWQEVRDTALAEGRRLALPPAPVVTEEAEEGDFRQMGDDESLDVAPITDRDVALLADGGKPDARSYEARWFAAVKGTSLDNDKARAGWLADYTEGLTSSLAEFLESASVAEADRLMVALYEAVLPELGPDAYYPADEADSEFWAGYDAYPDALDRDASVAMHRGWVQAMADFQAQQPPDDGPNPIFSGGRKPPEPTHEATGADGPSGDTGLKFDGDPIPSESESAPDLTPSERSDDEEIPRTRYALADPLVKRWQELAGLANAYKIPDFKLEPFTLPTTVGVLRAAIGDLEARIKLYFGDAPDAADVTFAPGTMGDPIVATIVSTGRPVSQSESLRQTAARLSKKDADAPATGEELGDLEERMHRATRLGIDLAPYDIDTRDATRGQVRALAEKLSVAIHTAESEAAHGE